LADAVSRVSPAIAEEIRALAKEQSARAIEDRLIELERKLIEQIPDLESIRAEVAETLAGSKLDEKTRARTEEAMLLRFVREKYALPRLSLFG